ncbi:hypothetical protein [Embleya scabrispora]|uniref:hypothetical protein n=1 Tax=Embleya scabrispora TaxID=159449 RepID=UPI000381216A|nr:hypothetical protein [Embleya scabrispora]MYS83940.1 hypothetical protein [Streptomyces sp. SID5474]
MRDFTETGLVLRRSEDVRREAVRRNADLVRVDCYPGGDGALVRQYQAPGFTPVTTFLVERPGQPPRPGRLPEWRPNSRQR